MTFRKISLTFLFIFLSVACLYAKKQPKYEQAHPLTPEQAALVERAIGREKVLIKNIQQRTPLVETYIQNTKPDIKLYQVPISDEYMLSRVDFGKGFFDKAYEPRSTKSKQGFFKNSVASIAGLSKALKLDSKIVYNPLGITEMMFLDPHSFDNQHYEFSFVRKEFLGSVRTWVFDVHPKSSVKDMGRFTGRIWVEDTDGNIVRFNGTYTSGSTSYHLKITDMAVVAGLAGLGTAFGVQEDKEDADGYEKTGTVDGHLQSEAWRKGASSGKFGVIVANRFDVEAEGSAGSIDDLKAAVATIDQGRLSSLAG